MKAAVLGRDAAVVNRYRMKDDMYDLRVKSFDEDLMDWIDFVCRCRDGETDYRKYDPDRFYHPEGNRQAATI